VSNKMNILFRYVPPFRSYTELAYLLLYYYCIIFYCNSATTNKRDSVLFCSDLIDMLILASFSAR